MSAAVETLRATRRAALPTALTAVFIHLRDEMAGAENCIAVGRQRDNEVVAADNRTAHGFPGQHVYCNVAEEAKQTPTR